MTTMTADPVPHGTSYVRGRAITLTREAGVFRLAFRFDRDLVTRCKETLPHSTFDPDSKSWTTPVSAQSVNALRRMWHEGLLDVGPDDLLHPGEQLTELREAVLRSGTKGRPFYVHFATRGSNSFPSFKSLPGAEWSKKASALTFPPTAAVALAEFVDRGLLTDEQNMLQPAEVTVAFDGRTGQFGVRGNPRAAEVFHEAFPTTDVVGLWTSKGLDAAFLDDFSAKMYAGELARAGAGYQPPGMTIDLFDYQRRSVALGLARDGLGIYHAPGLGKSAIGIAIGHELLRTRAVARVVIVVPSAVRTQWRREISKFTGYPEANVIVVDGDKKKRTAAYEAAMDARWVIVHYDVLSRDLALAKPMFTGALVIADEAHRVKSHRAARSEALRELAKGAIRRVALTGTPIEREPDEWYEVLNFSQPGCLGGPMEYLDRYRWKAPFGGYEGARNLHELRERSRPFYIRYTKEQVAEHLPPLQVQTLTIDPDPTYAALLKRAHSEAAAELKAKALERLGARNGVDLQAHPDELTLLSEDDVEETKTGAEMSATSMLRLLCSSPRLVQASDSPTAQMLLEAGLIPDDDGPKLDELRSLMAERLATQIRRKQQMADDGVDAPTADMVRGERVVVFTYSKRMANLIADRMVEDNVPYVMFTGDTSSDDRDAAVAAFTDPTSDVVAFIATDAAAEGLNLGACCSSLYEMEPASTATRSEQRRNRIHRIDGTAKAYQVTQFVLAGTVEHGIVALAESRAQMADTILGETGGKAKTSGSKRRTRRDTRGGGASLFEQALREHEVDPKAGLPRRRKPTADDLARAKSGAAADDGANEHGQLSLL